MLSYLEVFACCYISIYIYGYIRIILNLYIYCDKVHYIKTFSLINSIIYLYHECALHIKNIIVISQ